MLSRDLDGFHEALSIQVALEMRTAFPVDVHDFGALPTDIQFRVLNEGVVLVDAGPRTRVRREVAAQLAYYDFLPYLNRIRQGALRRVAAGAADG